MSECTYCCTPAQRRFGSDLIVVGQRSQAQLPGPPCSRIRCGHVTRAVFSAKPQIYMVDSACSDAGPVSVMRARKHKEAKMSWKFLSALVAMIAFCVCTPLLAQHEPGEAFLGI